MPGAARSPASWRKKLGLVALSSAVALLAAELGLRAWAGHENAQTLRRALEAPPKIAPNGQATLGGIIRLAGDDRIAYELKPNMKEIVFKDGVLSTDSRGFRSPELPPQRLPNTVTIVGIGDSIMFGHGVSNGDCYLDQLRARLAAEQPEIDWRVVNTGVPGYSTVMEVATLELKCLGLEPDLVILGVVGNDYDPPMFVREETDVLDPSRSFLWDFVQARIGARARPAPSPNGLTYRDVWAKDHAPGSGVPPRYGGLFGQEAFLGALEHLRELSQAQHFDVLAFATIDFESAPEMMQAAEQRGFPTLHLQPRIVEYMERDGQAFDWERYKQSDLVVSQKNLHPSLVQHRMAAEELLGWMRTSGWLERIVRARGTASGGR